ncbi:hypothetical protein WJX72_009830 [[Myrmecia] bisecta]|uniref:Uncharacterized protein n=1 Tax=[Myrmecia] bisecta TaxID=41462 RepID=A0AAW1PFT2_9CHLO
MGGSRGRVVSGACPGGSDQHIRHDRKSPGNASRRENATSRGYLGDGAAGVRDASGNDSPSEHSRGCQPYS